MLDFNEKRFDFVSNLNVIQLKEISAVKKTCIFKIVISNIESFAVFKFGKLVNLYCSPSSLKNFLVQELLNENYISHDVSSCLKNSEINLSQVIDCLKAEEVMPVDHLDSIKQNFFSEFIQLTLFDKNSEYFHIGQADFSELLKDSDHECILERAQLDDQFVGHLILDTYFDKKKIEETFELGNCVNVDGIRDELPKAAQFTDSNVPVEMLLSKVPGLIRFSLLKLHQCLTKNDLEFSNVVFDEGLIESSEVQVKSDLVAQKNDNQPNVLKSKQSSNKKFSLYNPNKLGRIIELFSLIE